MLRHSSRVVDIARPAAKMIYEALATPFSRQLTAALNRGDQDLVNFPSPDPSSYNSASLFRKDYLASQLLAKFSDFDLPLVDRKKAALSKFTDSETSCLHVNSKLTNRYWERTITPPALQVFQHAKRKIAKLLGPFSWDEAEEHFGFGPGACVGLPRLKGDAYHKLRVKPTVTASNLNLAYCAVMRTPKWAESVFSTQFPLLNLTHEQMALLSFDVVAGNKIVTVPKNAKTDRTIAIEPLMNVYIQMGLGRCIRHRLLRAGIDLRTQEVNQVLALQGSVDGTLATIDLSGASDSISLKLVERLLPEDWVTAIKQCRSPRGVLPDGSLVTYEKVSSMGNGFTFDLETLIFWAFSQGCMTVLNRKRAPVAVYGDDIIIHTDCAGLLIQALSEFGFTTNKDKTFICGPFRESCGKHYFQGLDVTPFYIRHAIKSDLSRFTLANNLRRWAFRPNLGSCDSDLLETWETIFASATVKGRSLRVPDGFGDIGFVSNLDEATPVFDKELWAYSFKGLTSLTRGKVPNDASFLLKCLYDMERVKKVESDQPRIVPRKSAYRLAKVYTTQWRNFGPWE